MLSQEGGSEEGYLAQGETRPRQQVFANLLPQVSEGLSKVGFVFFFFQGKK